MGDIGTERNGSDGVGYGRNIEASIELLPEAASVSMARRFVRETLDGWNLQPMSDEVQLVASELATNSVLHAQSSSNVHLKRVGNRLRLEVSDASSVQPVHRHYGVTAATGRGIGLVDAVASKWGTTARSNGKTVWCEFEIPDGH